MSIDPFRRPLTEQNCADCNASRYPVRPPVTLPFTILFFSYVCFYFLLSTQASRLRLFHVSNTWVIFENALLLGQSTDSSAAEAVVEGEFPDLQDIPEHRFGAQDRGAAVDPNEDAFLEVEPPAPPRTRHGLLAQQTDRLSDAALSTLDHKVMFVDSNVIWVQGDAQVGDASWFSYCFVLSPIQSNRNYIFIFF